MTADKGESPTRETEARALSEIRRRCIMLPFLFPADGPVLLAGSENPYPGLSVTSGIKAL
ncbi:hypothetical protein AA0312_2628 [Acetobacter tropicalis NRIC 0312]|uniref:Uncharacterized protein n=1 Tax=Acetobacter tropicalis TaxID=104102 RepID=A0A511FP78_9PROT|nr:hypothetical protein ATR1_039d0100 [Acetobacter tropicalis]GBR71982.1 hypothetical protein AA0312_2628 [Acetobacter tropicalis NRIC 0312]GEL50736.1 hypothetical protein ATR01nite_18110 [Acetobacter tropicalis]